MLDFNGFLLERQYEPDRGITAKGAERFGNFLTWKRPGADAFLDFALANFDVCFWTSARRQNALRIFGGFFAGVAPRLLCVLDQSDCQVESSGNRDKPLFLKNLSRVWRRFPQHGVEDTLIIDDSQEKLQNNPPRCCILAATWRHDKPDDGSIEPGGRIWALLAERCAK